MISPQKRPKLDVFEGRQVALSNDLGIGPHLLGSITEIIKQGGGSVTSDVAKANIVICRYREGVSYRLASRLNKEVGNLSWLYHLMTYNTWTSPLRRLLHYPVSRSGIPGFKGLKISLSNYVGEARAYLENLIAATGAECTKTLRQENTHLVTAHGNSEKCNAAKEWGLQVVNHLWLEESYAKWKLQPVSDPRYTHFPRRTNLGEVVGQTRLDKAILEHLFFPSEPQSPDEVPRRAMQNKDQNAAAAKASGSMDPPPPLAREDDDDALVSGSATPVAKSRKAADNKKLHTPARSRLTSEGKENDTPSSTSSRKSKDAATARLHEIAPDIALYEREKKRVGGVIYGGRRKSDEDRVAMGKKRTSAEPEVGSDAEEAGDAKRQKKSKPSVTMHLLITGYQPWVGHVKREDADKVSRLFLFFVTDIRLTLKATTSRTRDPGGPRRPEVFPCRRSQYPADPQVCQCARVWTRLCQCGFHCTLPEGERTVGSSRLPTPGQGRRKTIRLHARQGPNESQEEQEQAAQGVSSAMRGNHSRGV